MVDPAPPAAAAPDPAPPEGQPGREDLTGKYNTKLTPDEEKRFEAWAKANGRQGDTYDYDLRGAWKDDAQTAENGHLPDKWKKPNHPTFSDESVYNGKDGKAGGKWVQGPDGKWRFLASDWNVKNMGEDGLSEYFRQNEPESVLWQNPNLQQRLYPKDAK